MLPSAVSTSGHHRAARGCSTPCGMPCRIVTTLLPSPPRIVARAGPISLGKSCHRHSIEHARPGSCSDVVPKKLSVIGKSLWPGGSRFAPVCDMRMDDQIQHTRRGTVSGSCSSIIWWRSTVVEETSSAPARAEGAHSVMVLNTLLSAGDAAAPSAVMPCCPDQDSDRHEECCHLVERDITTRNFNIGIEHVVRSPTTTIERALGD